MGSAPDPVRLAVIFGAVGVLFEILPVRRCHIGAIDNHLAAGNHSDRVSWSARHDLVLEVVDTGGNGTAFMIEECSDKAIRPSSLDDDLRDP